MGRLHQHNYQLPYSYVNIKEGRHRVKYLPLGFTICKRWLKIIHSSKIKGSVEYRPSTNHLLIIFLDFSLHHL